MKPISLPSSYNYIGAFLSFRCNMNCSYCINRQGKFKCPPEMPGKDWIAGLSRIATREDLPITLQGGEPTIHKDFYIIANELHKAGKHLDVLTNGEFDENLFMQKINRTVFQRKAKYACIRFSYHDKTNPLKLALKVFKLKDNGYSVGIWGLNHPDMIQKNREMKVLCQSYGIDYREKEYLDDTHGTYKYPTAVIGKKQKKVVQCRTSELLIAPDGGIFRCHSDLYAGINPIAGILNENLAIESIWRPCKRYGLCNSCDVKLKTNRLQEFGHTSVEIKDETT